MYETEILEENDVDGMTTRELQAAVQRYKEENKGLQTRIEGLLTNRKDGLTASQAEELKIQLELEKDKVKDADKAAKGKDKTITRLEEQLKEAEQVQLKEMQTLAEAKAEVPEAVQKELEELREREKQRKAAEEDAATSMKREGAEYAFRAIYGQFKNDFERMAEALGAITGEKQEKYREATVKALDAMKEKLT